MQKSFISYNKSHRHTKNEKQTERMQMELDQTVKLPAPSRKKIKYQMSNVIPLAPTEPALDPSRHHS